MKVTISYFIKSRRAWRSMRENANAINGLARQMSSLHLSEEIFGHLLIVLCEGDGRSCPVENDDEIFQYNVFMGVIDDSISGNPKKLLRRCYDHLWGAMSSIPYNQRSDLAAAQEALLKWRSLEGIE